MFQALFNSLSGLFSFSKSLNTVSNNVSNMNTPGFHPLRRNVIDELTRADRQSLEALVRLTLEETMYKKSHVRPVVDGVIEDTIVEQVANGRSYAEKVYRLTNGGSRAEQQGTLFS